MSASGVSASNWALFFLCVGLWGSAYAGVHVALEGGAPPWAIVAGRLWIASGILNALLFIRRRQGKEPPPTPGVTLKLAFLGLLGAAAPFALLSYAQLTITSGLAGILAALTPIIVGVTAPLVAPNERVTSNRIIGLLLGFLGVVVLTGADALKGLGGGGAAVIGQLAAAGAAIAYALNTLVARSGPQIPALEAAAGWITFGALWSTPMALMTFGDAQLDIRAITAITLLGIGPTAIASIAYFHLLNTAGPSFVTQTNYCLPLWAVALGAVAFGEVLHWNAVIALVLIGLGLFTTQGGWRVFRFG